VISAGAGLGLKPEHCREVAETRPPVGFFEVHAENYMGDGGPPHHWLGLVRRDYPISLHGVGLSIGGEGPLDRDHLARLKSLNDRYQPGLFSEHLAWSSHGIGYLADLLPLPYTRETLGRVCEHIDQTQSAMGRQMLLENPSSYLAFEESGYAEADFIREIVARTGCALLLDINNVFISSRNLGFSPEAYLDDFPLDRVSEFHLAGHTAQNDGAGAPLIIDDHGSSVVDDVWSLFDYALSKTGPLPVLIERDANVPPLGELLDEAAIADAALKRAARRAAA
jgi:uncharacterized protein